MILLLLTFAAPLAAIFFCAGVPNFERAHIKALLAED